jgi:hypothetical protein
MEFFGWIGYVGIYSLLRYGMNEGKDRYWVQFFGPIPEKLADI